MDEYHASRKRLRASYPGLSGQGSSSSDGFSSHGLTAPALESQGYPSPMPTLAPTGSTQASARKDSPVPNTTLFNGKRKVVEVVDLTEEPDTTPRLPSFLGGDVIDLTEDKSYLSQQTAPKDRSAWEVAYRAKKLRERNLNSPVKIPYPHSYSAVQDHPSSHGVKQQQLYSSSSFGYDSRPHSDMQASSNSQQYPNPRQYAHAQQSQFPLPYPQSNASVLQTFGATPASWTTGTSRGNDRFDIKPGAQYNAERSVPTHSLTNGLVQRFIDPRDIMGRKPDVSLANTRQMQGESGQGFRAEAVPPPDSVSGAQEQTGTEVGKLDPPAARAFLQSWAANARKVPCSGCNTPMLSGEVVVNMLFKRWLEAPKMTISSVVSCNACSAETCLGCGRRCHSAGSDVSANAKDGSKLRWCCDFGRLILLWILLCGCDRRKTARRKRGEYFTKNNKSSRASVSGAGIGYGSHTTYGFESVAQANQAMTYGMYGQLNNSSLSLPQHVDALPTAERAEDEITARVMACLDALLPSLVAENTSMFDLEPPTPLLVVLTQSNILGTIAALLRNDSLEDATKRFRLYNNTLNVVDKLSRHPATADLTVNQARKEGNSPSDILRLCFSSNNDLNDDKYEETDSLAACLRNLDIASKSILTRAKAHPQDFVGGNSEQMLSLCEKVSQTADTILASAKRSPSLPDQTATAQTNDDWQSELAVLELPDEVIMTRHSHATLAAGACNLAKGRMKSLSIQLSNLTSSVPPGVFVRYCASRLDVMKVLIIGPKDTPYENGLFEFDLFCPAQFPNVPPLMQFRTTGGGRVRFNPNLYNDGKGMHTLYSYLPINITVLTSSLLATNSLPITPRHMDRSNLATRQIHHPANPRLHPSHDILRRTLVQRARQADQRRRLQGPQPRPAGPHCPRRDAELAEARRGVGLGRCDPEAFRC